VELKIFIISLKNSKRREFQRKQFQKLNIDYEFIDAISSNDITENNFLKLCNDWQRPMKKSEVACYLSHQFVWKKVIESKIPTLILEDDTLISSDIYQLLKGFEKIEFCDLLNLANRGRKKFVSRRPIFSNANYSVFKLYLDTTGAAGYILWPSGAKKLLDCEASKGLALADAQIYNCRSLKSFQVEPSPIIQLDMVGHYGIKYKFDEEISKSSVSSNARLKKNLSFQFKRIWAQLKLGLYQAKISFSATKRFISILPEKFSGPP